MSPCPCTPRSLLEPGGPRFLDPALRVTRQELDRQDRKWRMQGLPAAADTTATASTITRDGTRAKVGSLVGGGLDADAASRASQETKVASDEKEERQQHHEQWRPSGAATGSKSTTMLTRWRKVLAS